METYRNNPLYLNLKKKDNEIFYNWKNKWTRHNWVFNLSSADSSYVDRAIISGSPFNKPEVIGRPLNDIECIWKRPWSDFGKLWTFLYHLKKKIRLLMNSCWASIRRANKSNSLRYGKMNISTRYTRCSF